MRMPSYDFKSVGELTSARKFTKAVEKTPIGFKTPMEIGNSSAGIFEMHTDIGNQIQDNLRNMILTNKGDRLGRFDFGADLSELALELGSENGDREAITRISHAIKKFMPFIEPETFTVNTDHMNNQHIGKILIRLTYNVPTLGIRNKALEVTLFVAG